MPRGLSFQCPLQRPLCQFQGMPHAGYHGGRGIWNTGPNFGLSAHGGFFSKQVKKLNQLENRLKIRECQFKKVFGYQMFFNRFYTKSN